MILLCNNKKNISHVNLWYAHMWLLCVCLVAGIMTEKKNPLTVKWAIVVTALR